MKVLEVKSYSVNCLWSKSYTSS